MPKVQQFKVGERVVINDLGVGGVGLRNAVGTIREVRGSGSEGYNADLGIEFDRDIKGHDLCGNIKKCNGWYVPIFYVKKLDKQLELAFE
jgi:hypothetical protein